MTEAYICVLESCYVELTHKQDRKYAMKEPMKDRTEVASTENVCYNI